jgi:PucR family transcriptional regulator, purine catabolism regulatory protein
VLPTVADVLALDPVRRGAPRVITGADLLGAPVRWVHVIELAEAGHLLSGGELVLSTGIALPPDADGLARYVAGLAAAGVSALAVELGARYVRELPRALVTAAVVHKLPLIVLERETQFIAITEAVHAQILDAQVAELRAAQRLHRVFTDLAVAGADQDEIVSQASALAGVPVILADLAHRVLACAPAGQEAAVLLAGFAGRSRAAVVAGRTGFDPAPGWLVATVGGQGVDWGRLIFVLPGPPDAGTSVIAERAVTTLALARLVRAGGASDAPAGAGRLGGVSGRPWPESPERAAHRSVLASLAGPGYTDPDDLAARITALGVPLAGRRLLPVVAWRPDRDDPRAVTDALAAACTDLGLPAICGTLGDQRSAALLALPAGASEDDALTRLAGRLGASAVGPAAVIGVGPAAADVAQVRHGLSDAVEAAALAAGSGSGRRYVRLADLRLTGLLYQLRDDPRVLAFAERELGPLLAHDERAGTSLVQVLASYLAAGGNKAAAASRAGLARPTLYERLRQIEELCQVSVVSAESRVALHAALIVLRERGDVAC